MRVGEYRLYGLGIYTLQKFFTSLHKLTPPFLSLIKTQLSKLNNVNITDFCGKNRQMYHFFAFNMSLVWDLFKNLEIKIART